MNTPLAYREQRDKWIIMQWNKGKDLDFLVKGNKRARFPFKYKTAIVSIRKILRKNGINPPDKIRRKVNHEEIIEDCKTMTIDVIALKHKTSEANVRKIASKNNITYPHRKKGIEKGFSQYERMKKRWVKLNI